MKTLAIPAIAGILSLGAAAQAKDAPRPDAMAAAVRYGLPHALAGLRSSCAGQLAPDGYLANHGDALEAKFSQGADAAWPAAKTVLLDMAGDEAGDDSAALFAAMPDQNLRPFVDGIITSLVATKVKPDQCEDAERALSLLDPLPAENIAGLVGFMIEMAQKRDPDAKGAADD